VTLYIGPTEAVYTVARIFWLTSGIDLEYAIKGDSGKSIGRKTRVGLSAAYWTNTSYP